VLSLEFGLSSAAKLQSKFTKVWLNLIFPIVIDPFWDDLGNKLSELEITKTTE
jgi:hypothetical protein